MAYRKPKRFFEDSGLVIMLDYKGRKYIFETKINRGRLSRTIDLTVDRISSKYMLNEQADEGYVVVFDPKRNVGEITDPEERCGAMRKVTVFVVAIGKTL